MESAPLEDIQSLIYALKRERLILRTIALVFMGAGINILFIGLSSWVFAHSATDVPIFVLPQQNQQQSAAVTGTQVAFYLVYVILGIAYSVGVSIAFKPKRIISPLIVQVITSSFYSVIIATPLILYAQMINNPNLASNTFGLAFSAMIIFVIVGFLQRIIVRSIVGLNGSIDDIEKRVLPLNEHFQRMKQIILDDGFLGVCDFRRLRSRSKDKIILESKARTSKKIILVLTPDSNNSDKSILAASAYEEFYDTIAKTPSASKWLDSVLLLLDKETRKPEMHEDLTNSQAYATAIRVALEVTEPKISGIVYLPRWQITTLISTGILAVLVTIGYWQTWLELGAFLTTMILIAIELLFVFMPHVIESAKKDSEDKE